MPKLKISGAIISNNSKWFYEYLEMESACPKDVTDFLEKYKEEAEIEVEINSGGGSVFAGAEMYTALKNANQKVIVTIPSLAGSSASVVAMSGDVVNISPMAQIMIHNSSIGVQGNRHKHNEIAEVLGSLDKAMATAYHLKTGLPMEEIHALMDKETWLGAERAKELGFADNIMFMSTGETEKGGITADQLVASNVPYVTDELVARLKEKMYASGSKDEVAKALVELEILALSEIKE